MIQLQGLSQSYPDSHLYENIDFQFFPNEKVALIGRNGTGKSTLLKIIAGEESPNKGSVLIPKQVSIAYLPQEPIATFDSEVLNYCLMAHKDLIEKEKKVQHLSNKISDKNPDSEKLLQQISTLQNELEHSGFYTLEMRAKKILSGLGFSENDFNKELKSLSGGWRMRVLLARILLKEPDFILLDEPSNHLDYESLDWLENFLRTYPRGLVIVSHDRRLLDNIIDVTVELNDKKLKRYPGNFSFFLAEQEKNNILKEKNRELREKEILRIQRFIDRFRSKASKAKQVQSRVKALDKIQLEKIEQKSKDIAFRFLVENKSGKTVFKLCDLSKSYEKTLFENVNTEVIRNDKIALLGANGSGKSTLIKLLLSELKPDNGIIEKGHNVEIGYFSQHQYEALDPEKTIIDELNLAASEENRTKVRKVLGHFLFSNDDVFKKIGVLSGGEKARVSLAKLLVSPINTLIMDEPTNHLDLNSKEILQDALMDFNGTIILISHDRDFLDGLVNKIWYLKNKSLQEYLSDFSDFEERYHQENELSPDNTSEKSQKKNDFEEQKKLKNYRRKLEKEVLKLEEKQTEIETSISQIKEKMFDVTNHEKLIEMQTKLDKLNDTSQLLMEEWEKKQLELEKINL